eukprot:scaffold16850_cov58-Phaeocystis_antarctica.AAC.3
MQGAHSGLTASAGLSHTPAMHSAAQGRPSLQGPSPTPDMHAFSPSSNLQQPTAAHADELSPLFSQASSPFANELSMSSQTAGESGEGEGCGEGEAAGMVSHLPVELPVCCIVWWQAMQAAHSGLEASASLTHTPAGQHAAQGFIDCWQTMQGAHSGLTASAGLSHTPAVHSAAQGRPSLQGPSPTPDMHSPFSPSSYMQQPTAAHADELSPLFSQASSPFWPTGASDRARPSGLASKTGAPLCEWSAKAGEETASAWPVADSSSSPMRRAFSGVAELPAAGFEGREVTAVICGGRARSAAEQQVGVLAQVWNVRRTR